MPFSLAAGKGHGMIWGSELVDHAWAAVVVLGAACTPGYALAGLLPRPFGERAGALAWPLLGGAYWAVTLYALPFAGGMVVAALLAVVATIIRFWKQRRASRRVGAVYYQATQVPRRTLARDRWARALLVLGCLPYLTPLFAKHVPDGMDSARYAMNVRLISRQAGLPRTLAPFAPQIPFGAANHGVPALAAVAVLSGGSPVAATLASIPLTFFMLACAIYLLLRVALPRRPAAVWALAWVWMANLAQRTVPWGGFPEVAALALGLFALRLLIEVRRSRGWGTAVLLGLCAGAMPLIHGCAAAGWLYVLGPVGALAALSASRSRRRALLRLVLAVGVALLTALVYVAVAQPQLDAEARTWIETHELHSRADVGGLTFLATSFGTLLGSLGQFPLLVFIAAVIVLARWRWRVLALLLVACALNVLVMANARYKLLPASYLLYPGRMREFMLPIAALAAAVAWRVWGRRHALRQPACRTLTLLLLALAFTHHWRYYQRAALEQPISDGSWQALQWARAHLSPEKHFVGTFYAGAGAWLPAVAGVGCNNWHAHISEQLSVAKQMAAERELTHLLIIERDAIRTVAGRDNYDWHIATYKRLIRERSGWVVFQAGPARVYELGGIED
ncbi:MAG: hypothetical protein KKB50_01235 [Planctomycetes bacterium]|nr:hypothetical protein [Planctomycetota bacterium]